MKRIQLLLAVRPKLFGESLRDVLQRELNVDVVGEVYQPVDAFIAVRRQRPDVVVHSWADVSRTPWFYSLWLDEHPGLVIVSVSDNLLRVFRGVNTAHSITSNEVPFLLGVLRRLCIEGTDTSTPPRRRTSSARKPANPSVAGQQGGSTKTAKLLFAGWMNRDRPFSGR